MKHADFKVLCVSDEAIFIEDLDRGNLSVTNDAEHVVRVLLDEHGNKKIVYKDTMGQWDELIHNGNVFLDFGPWKGTIPDTI